jgi:PPK2 family polyphosphate:nucleotide phosphotransferase
MAGVGTSICNSAKVKPVKFAVKPATKVRLADFDPADTAGFSSKSEAEHKLLGDVETLAELQDKLSAQAAYGVLIVLQGMDTAGKDGAIKHVMTGVNPAGVNVHSFKQPSAEEMRHDYLWRTSKVLPARGEIAIFNRSYYENVLVTRVHPALLGEFEATAKAQGDAFWERRFADLANFEHYLAHNDILVLKFFLHISKEEQKRRLLERLDDAAKQWKFSAADLQERSFWDEYLHAYEQMLGHTSTAFAPWYVIAANHKWFARLAVANILAARLKKLDLAYPKLSPSMQEQLAQAKSEIETEH